MYRPLSSIIIVLIFCLSFINNANCQTDSIAGPFLTISVDTVNYGTILKDSNGERFVTVNNTGNEELMIEQCDGTCGCTVAKCPKKAIQAGSSAKISISYDTTKVGIFDKTVIIRSNAINHTAYIKVIGEVKP